MAGESFRSLVEAIDAKWGHTYQDFPASDEFAKTEMITKVYIPDVPMVLKEEEQ